MSASTDQLVQQLVDTFEEQVRRAVGLELDGSVTSLAFVDHHLTQARNALREHAPDARDAPILGLVAAGAGAYLGELVRREIGGTWIGDGKDPRRLRFLLEPQFVHFSPVDQAFEALLGEDLDEDDPRLPAGPPVDTAFRVRTRPVPDATGNTPQSDDDWLQARLAEMPPVPAEHYFSLTGRYETLLLVLELLANKHAAEGRTPVSLRMEDYAAELADRADGGNG